MSVGELWKNANDLISNVQELLGDFYDFFMTMVNFLPSPFKEILLAAISIIIIIIIYKILKG